MAERRMFAKSVIETDAFLDMPNDAKVLYFYFNSAADDRGFVDNPRAIMRMCGATDDAVKILIAKKFVLVFEKNGDIIYLIRHWRVHNYIAKDRFKETKYRDILQEIYLDSSQAYSMEYSDRCIPCIQDVDKVSTQVRIGKGSKGKEREGKESKGKNNNITHNKDFVPPSLDDVKAYVKERGSSVDPEQFYDYFTTGNWVDAKGQKVKNWKQKLITWEKYNPVKKEEKEDDFGNWGTTL